MYLEVGPAREKEREKERDETRQNYAMLRRATSVSPALPSPHGATGRL